MSPLKGEGQSCDELRGQKKEPRGTFINPEALFQYAHLTSDNVNEGRHGNAKQAMEGRARVMPFVRNDIVAHAQQSLLRHSKEG